MDTVVSGQPAADQLNAVQIARRFATLSPEQRSAVYDKMRARGLSMERMPIPPRNGNVPAVLSYAQQRQWFLWRLDPSDTAYHIAGALRLCGRLDVAVLRDALRAVVARHGALRTVLQATPDGLAAPRVVSANDFDITVHDVGESDELKLVEQLIGAPFDLTRDLPLRVHLLRLGADNHVLTVVMHHIAADDWSMGIVINEFAAEYAARVEGRTATPPIPAIDYADYAEWQRHWMEAGERDRQLAYWRAHLEGEQPVLALPVDHATVPGTRHARRAHAIALPDGLVYRLRRRARAENVSLFAVLLTGFQATLHRVCGQDDIRIGTPVANRRRAETAGVVGLFVNTQVARLSVVPGMRLDQALADNRAALRDGQLYQDLPFEHLVEALQPERSLEHSPLFQVLHNHLHQDDAPLERLPGLTVEWLAPDGQTTQFPLVLDTAERRDGSLGVTFTCAAGLFEPATIDRLAWRYLRMLEVLADAPETAIRDVDLLAPDESAVLRGWGRTRETRTDWEPVHHMIERQARVRPDALALIFGEQRLSFDDLNRRADRLARRLIIAGVGLEIRVAVALERSVEMVVGLLAVLKAGGAYVPLDPAYPAERLHYMLADSGAALLLTSRRVEENWRPTGDVPTGDIHVVRTDDDVAGETDDDLPRLAVDVAPGNLAYVVYTSGSTGRPKGVAVAHGPLAMHVQTIGEMYGMGPDDRELQFASISFDGAHERTWVPLAFGAALLPRDEEIWPVERTCTEIARHGVTVACFTPGYLGQLAALMGEAARTLPIRSYTVGGEAMPRSVFDRVRDTLAPPRIVNGYGPTETVITPMVDMTGPEDDFSAAYMPIGRLVGDRVAYVLDRDLNLVPPGAAGELYLGGLGLARGYLGRPGLTAERFVASPFDGGGARLYRTGDLVRWGAGGRMEYLGRIDQQVKIRGFRIELGEVEACLNRVPGVREAVAAVRPGLGGDRLVAYVVAGGDGDIQPETIRGVLAASLPDFMVPGAVVMLKALPLTPAGKVDRQALPAPDTDAVRGDAPAPRGAAEEALAAVWAQALQVRQIGRFDNFFELGGDSILSLQVVAHMRRAGWRISPKQVFERQNLADLAAIAEPVAQAATRLGDGGGAGETATPLTPIQADFFDRSIPARHHWNQSVALAVPPDLDLDRLESALAVLVRRHDALRLRFDKDADGRWRQTEAGVDDPATVAGLLWRPTGGVEPESAAALRAALQQSLNLEQGPLLRAAIVDAAAGGERRLLLVIHHLVVDGVSWRILLEDLRGAYEGVPATANIADANAARRLWAQRLRDESATLFADEFDYWRAAAEAPLALPYGNSGPGQEQGVERDRENVALTVDETMTRALLRDAHAAYRTRINDLLLTALGRALCRWSGHQRLLIDLEGHGREPLFDDIDLSRTVGWFTSVFPVVLEPLGDFAVALPRIKETLRGIPHNGVGFGALRRFGTASQREALNRVPAAQVVFNYLGQFDAGNGAAWTPTLDPVGPERDDDAPLDRDLSIGCQVLGGGVSGGRLRLTADFSRRRFFRSDIERLLEDWRRELDALCQHCLSGAVGVTPTDFPLAGLSQEQLNRLPVEPGRLADLYPLSPMQQGMLFHSMFDAGSGAYLNQLRVDIEKLDPERFQAAWRAAFHRHAILRSGFLHDRETPLQWVAADVELPLAAHDWRDRGDLAAALDDLAQSERDRGFDLSQPPLTRFALVRTGPDRHHFIWTVHHLLLDGWSVSRLIGDVLRHYAGAPDRPMGGRYRDYIAWLLARDPAAAEAYWRGALARLDAPTHLAAAVPAPLAGRSGYATVELLLPVADTRDLMAFAKRERVTLAVLVQGAWALLLRSYLGRSAVAFGTTVAGRPDSLHDAGEILGLFINTLPVIAAPAAGQPVGAWLRDLQAQGAASREHEHAPLYDIQRWAGSHWPAQGGQGLFDTLVVFENYPLDAAVSGAMPDGLAFSGIVNRSETHYPLTLTAAPAEGLRLTFSYACNRFASATVAAIADGMIGLLTTIAADPARPVGTLSPVAADARQQLATWGQGDVEPAGWEPAHHSFQRRVRENPQATALLFGDEAMSYDQLNRRANRLAHRLIGLGVGPETAVGVVLRRSFDLLVAVLGTMKAGAAYVPLDPDYPAERLAYMASDCGSTVLLTAGDLTAAIPTGRMTIVDLGAPELAQGRDDDPAVEVHGDGLAYVIYTSGSTGRPKAAANRRRALASRLAWMRRTFDLGADDVFLQKTPFGFDVSVWELFLPLTLGARLAIAAPDDHRDPAVLSALIRRHGVTMVHFVPSMLGAFVGDDADAAGDATVGACPSLRHVLSGGEALSGVLLARAQRRLPHATIHNLYGPAEAAIDVAHRQCGPGDEGGPVPIGRPIAATRAHILDADLNEAPPGIVGELYLGGVGLGRGYLGRPGLTAERFVADPLGDSGERLYRTGDLARWRADGCIEFLGRADHQVKIRGQRVELGEIEARLLEQPEIREAVAVVRREGGGALTAYVSLRPGIVGIDAQALRRRLAMLLPDYMVPAVYVVLPELPLNPSGKIDRLALPVPELSRTEVDEPPQGEAETAIAAVWSETLGVGRVGRHDNFFVLGGDSILSLQIVARLRRGGWIVTPRQIFEHQTPADLAVVLGRRDDRADVPLPPPARGRLADFLSTELITGLELDETRIEDVYPLSPTQEGMLFHGLEATGGSLYVNQLRVDLGGLDPDRFEAGWRVLTARHPVLRSAVLWRTGMARPLQIVYDRVEPAFTRLDWRGVADIDAEIAELAALEAARGFDMAQPPLSRLILIRLGEDAFRLLWTRHHILMDGWAESRLLGEWLLAYAGEALPPLARPYGDYVRWLAGRDSAVAERFWKAELAGTDGPTLLADTASPTGGDGFGKIYTRFDREETALLRAFARDRRVTLNTVVQAAWALLLQCHTGKDRVIFGATVAGRPPDLPGADAMLGLFINTIAVPAFPEPRQSVANFLQALQETNLRLREYEHSGLSDVQRWVGSAGRPLFDSIVVFENYPIDKTLERAAEHGLRVGVPKVEGLTGYAMDLQVVVGDTMEIEYCYSRAAFADEVAENLRRRMEHLIRRMVAAPECALGALDWLPEAETRAVVASGAGKPLVTVPQPVHRQIERQAALRPDAAALHMDDTVISYGAMDRRANRLAHRLGAAGIGPETVVAVAMGRSLDTLITFLAVLKAGAAYLPLDPALPPDRLAFMIADSGAKLLVVDDTVTVPLPDGPPRLNVATIDFGRWPDTPPDVDVHPESLAYVIYTSGSTGAPKGVAVAHGPLAAHCPATAEIYGLGPQSCELLFMSFAFDGAHERWLTALGAGARLVVRGDGLWTAAQALDHLDRYRVDAAAFPPAYLNQLAEWAAEAGKAPSTALYVFGGEAMPKAFFDRVRHALRPQQLINGYGPTETVITPLIWKTTADVSFDRPYAPIGRPVGARTAYILDPDMRLVPDGVAGELYIGGHGLARGYLGRAGLTAERFIADPFANDGGRLYRTGDLVRRLADGNIEYLGRTDHQVKIRGFRIELGEIEARIRQVSGVADAAVVVREEAAGRRLFAYVVPVSAPEGEALARRVRQRLDESLPDYMVPTHIVVVPALPRLISGKLDQAALPSPVVAGEGGRRAPLSTPAARRLGEIWRETLGIDDVGEQDNFFELGGDSLLSLKVLGKVRALGDPEISFTLRDLMQRPTIAALLRLGAAATAPPESNYRPAPLNRRSKGTAGASPLFCLHAGVGAIFDYQPLARRLQDVCDVYGLPCRMLSDPAHIDVSLVQMATDYRRAIRRTQPQGPYRLAGWSLGGSLAALVAAGLEAEGEVVGFLGLIDPYVPLSPRTAEDDWRRDLLDFAAVAVSDAVSGALAERLTMSPAVDETETAVAALLADALAVPGASVTAAPGFADLGAPELARMFMVGRRLRVLVAQSAALPAVKGVVHCWWAAERSSEDRSRLARQLGDPQIRAVDIAADHFAIIRNDDLTVAIIAALSPAVASA